MLKLKLLTQLLKLKHKNVKIETFNINVKIKTFDINVPKAHKLYMNCVWNSSKDTGIQKTDIKMGIIQKLCLRRWKERETTTWETTTWSAQYKFIKQFF